MVTDELLNNGQQAGYTNDDLTHSIVLSTNEAVSGEGWPGCSRTLACSVVTEITCL